MWAILKVKNQQGLLNARRFYELKSIMTAGMLGDTELGKKLFCNQTKQAHWIAAMLPKYIKLKTNKKR